MRRVVEPLAAIPETPIPETSETEAVADALAVCTTPATGPWRRFADPAHRVARRLAYLCQRLYWFAFRPAGAAAHVLVWSPDGLLLLRRTDRRGYRVPCVAAKGDPDRQALALAASQRLQQETGLAVHPDWLLPVGEAVSREDYKRERLYFFEVRLDTVPPLEIDGRTVRWAGFRSVWKARRLGLWQPLELQLSLRSARGELPSP